MNSVAIVCHPAADAPFRAYVELCLRELRSNAAAADLESALRKVYPLAVVRPTGRLGSVAGGQAVRYAYRDGDDPAAEDVGWWEKPDVAHLAFDTGGVFRQTDAAGIALFGARSEAEIAGHDWSEFSTPESTEAADRLWTELIDAGVLRTDTIVSTFTLRRVDGTEVPIEYRTVWDAEACLYRTTMRAVTVATGGEQVPAA